MGLKLWFGHRKNPDTKCQDLLPFITLIQLCTCRNCIIQHNQVQPFFSIYSVNGRKQHPAGVYSHHTSRWKIGDCKQSFPHKLLRLIICMNPRKNNSIRTCAVIEHKLQQLFALLYCATPLYLYHTKI